MAESLDMLRGLLSADNSVRGAAEKQYDGVKAERPQALIVAFLQVLPQTSVELPVREQAAVLLRQCLAKPKAKGSIWSKLVIEPSQREVMARLLELLDAEPSDKVRRKVADCVQYLGNQIIDIDDSERPNNAAEWPELIPVILRVVMDGSKSPAMRADGLWIMKELARSIWQLLTVNASQTVLVLQTCLSDGMDVVRAAAADLLCEVVKHVRNKEELIPFLPMVQGLCAVLRQLAESTDPQYLKTLLQSLAASIVDAAEFYKAALQDSLLPDLCRLARHHKDDEVRRLALEVLCCFVESKPKLVLKIRGGLSQIFEVCMHLLLELRDDVDAWACALVDDDDEEMVTTGAEVVDRIGEAMHKADCFEEALDAMKPYIAKLFQQADWKSTVAGLVLVRQIMEYVEDEDMVAQLTSAVLAQLKPTCHPRVRFAAWGCVQQLAQDHSEVVCSDEHSCVVLRASLQGLDDPCPRILLACLGAFQHFGENIDRDSLEPFVQPLMEKFGQKLQGEPSIIREAITCIAVVAGQIAEKFAQYYSSLMPVLKRIIAETVHKVEERVLLGKTFECVSLLATAVGKDAFKAEAQGIMESMLGAAQVAGLPKDDPIGEYTMAACERICSTMKEDFLPYLPSLLPVVLKRLALAGKECLDIEAALSLDHVDEDASFALVPGENGESKVVVMSSSELEDLQHAIECVRSFVVNLGKHFAPFVVDTARALLPVFEFSLKEEIRELAFDTWGQLCHWALEVGDKPLVADLVREFMTRILPKLAGLTADTEAMKTLTEGVTACLKEAGPGILGDEEVQHICRLTLKLIEESYTRQEERKKAVGDDADDSDEDDDEEKEEEETLRQSACNCATAVMTHHADAFVAHSLPSYLTLAHKLTDPVRAVGDRRCGLYVISSLSEHLGPCFVPYWGELLPRALRDSCDKDADVRSSACYAVSFLARQSAFAPYAAETAKCLAESIASVRGANVFKKKSDKMVQMAADNALSALVEILLQHPTGEAPTQAQLWATWVAGLPCLEDEDEGVRNHGILLRLVQEQRLDVVGAGNANLPKILSIFVDVYRTGMVDDFTSFKMGKLLVSLGQPVLEKYAESLSVKQRKKLVRIVRDGQLSVSTSSA